VQQIRDEAQGQRDVTVVLAAATKQAQTAKLKAGTVRAEAETAAICERLKVDRARAVWELGEARDGGSPPPNGPGQTDGGTPGSSVAVVGVTG